MYFSRNCSETFLIQNVMKAIIQLMRNKIIEVYTKILAGCRQKAEHSQIDVLRGALPAGGISVSCGVDLALPMVSSHQCWDTTNSTVERGVRSTRRNSRSSFTFLWRKHDCWKTAQGCEKNMQTPEREVIELIIQKGM